MPLVLICGEKRLVGPAFIGRENRESLAGEGRVTIEYSFAECVLLCFGEGP